MTWSLLAMLKLSDFQGFLSLLLEQLVPAGQNRVIIIDVLERKVVDLSVDNVFVVGLGERGHNW